MAVVSELNHKLWSEVLSVCVEKLNSVSTEGAYSFLSKRMLILVSLSVLTGRAVNFFAFNSLRAEIIGLANASIKRTQCNLS